VPLLWRMCSDPGMQATTVVLLAAAALLAGYCLGRRAGPAAPPQPPVPIDPKALELARRVLPFEGRIGAIKAYRDATGAGLRDAKLAVDTLDEP
jgi:ribosomal protein L7/L12